MYRYSLLLEDPGVAARYGEGIFENTFFQNHFLISEKLFSILERMSCNLFQINGKRDFFVVGFACGNDKNFLLCGVNGISGLGFIYGKKFSAGVIPQILDEGFEL